MYHKVNKFGINMAYDYLINISNDLNYIEAHNRYIYKINDKYKYNTTYDLTNLIA